MKKTKRTYISFSPPKLGKEEIREVVKTLKSGWITTGPKVVQFENAVREYVGTKYAIAVNSCTAGLHLSLLAAGVGKGDEVITTPLTFAATINVIEHTGARPVFVDINRETMNLDEAAIEKAITKKTKAIMPVHLAGRPCEMDAIMRVARKHGLFVLEDAAQAMGASYRGKKVGSLGDAASFSFYATKNITTAEGGMVTTDNAAWAELMSVYRLHGLSKDAWKRYSPEGYRHYEIVHPGYKYNLTDIAAAIGIHQMKKIARFGKAREKLWKYYDRELADLPITLPAPWPSYMEHCRHLYTILIDKERAGISRDAFMQKMHEAGIGTGVHFIPVHLHSYYRKTYGYKKGDFPNAEYIGERTVSIPLSPSVTATDAKYIVSTIRNILSKARNDGRLNT